MQTKKTYSFVFCLLSFVLILFSFFLFLFSCERSTAPVYNPQNLQLQVLDVSCTEVWLSLKAKNDYINKTLKLFQDDSLKLEKNLTAEDSILFVENLWPNTSYQFKVAIYDGNKLIAKSSTVSATTMDTTSHNFTWQTFEFGGQGGSSSFYDVAIIDENDIWAVGEIYTADDKYNAAHWNGEKWELKKIFIKGYFYPLKTIFSFGKTDIWVANLTMIHFNGKNIDYYTTPPLDENGHAHRITKIWGTSSSDLYVVGNSGLIAYYDGQQWQRIESWTDIDFHDIWGYGNIIIALASYRNYGRALDIVLINNQQAQILPKQGMHINMRSIWFEKQHFFAVGNGLYYKHYPVTSKKNWRNLEEKKLITQYYLYTIRGTKINNIYTAGAYGEVLYFNGIRWKSFFNTTHLNDGVYLRLDIRDNLICAVGNNYSKATILLGKIK